MPRPVHILLLLAALSQMAPVAEAQHFVDPAGRISRFDREAISLDEAVRRVERRFKAKAVKAEIAGDGERRVYVIRLMSDDGRVFTKQVDAHTGNIM